MLDVEVDDPDFCDGIPKVGVDLTDLDSQAH